MPTVFQPWRQVRSLACKNACQEDGLGYAAKTTLKSPAFSHKRLFWTYVKPTAGSHGSHPDTGGKSLYKKASKNLLVFTEGKMRRWKITGSYTFSPLNVLSHPWLPLMKEIQMALSEFK